MYQQGIGAPSPEPRESPALSIAKTVGVFVVAGLTIYLVLTAPTHWKRLSYWVEHFGQPNEAEIFVDLNAAPSGVSSAVGAALRQPTFEVPAATTVAEVAPEITEQTRTELKALNLQANHLVIPKLRLDTPIVWNSASDESIMLANLQQGVAHYAFTSLPNQEVGNVFITGHSSYYWWDPGRYKTVFALLDRLTAGDQAFLQYENTIYGYEMTNSVVVNPSQVEVTDPTAEPTLSLMTCTPVGTSLRRLVVRFRLASTFAADSGVAVADTAEPAEPTSVPIEPSQPAPTGLSVPVKRDVIRLLPSL